jgi:hypothetical protein
MAAYALDIRPPWPLACPTAPTHPAETMLDGLAPGVNRTSDLLIYRFAGGALGVFELPLADALLADIAPI